MKTWSSPSFNSVNQQFMSSNVSRVLAEILNTYTVDDVAVEDPPLEEVIASLFHSIAEAN